MTSSTIQTVILNGEEYKIFDGISHAIFTFPIFTNVLLNWGFGPRMLWKECNRLGIDRVEAEIKDVQARGGINNRGAYLRKRLENMQ